MVFKNEKYVIDKLIELNSPSNSFKTYRLLCLFSAIAIAVTGYMYNFVLYHSDILWLRGIIIGLLLLTLVLSYSSTWIQQNFRQLIYIHAGYIVVWTVYIVGLNKFNPDLAIALLMVFLAAGMVFEKVSHLALYYVLSNILVEITCLSMKNLLLDGLLFCIYTSTSSIIFFIVQRKNISTREQLLINQEYLSAIFNNAPEALAVVDSEKGVIYDCNSKFAQLYDHKSKKQIIGLSIAQFVYHFDMDWKSIFHAVLNKTVSDYELELQINDELIWVKVEATEIIQSNFNLTILQLINITEQKTTKHIQLVQQKNLENTISELNEILEFTTKDLRIPLRNISNLTDWMIEDYKEVLNEKGISQLEVINKKINKINQTLNSILVYNKVIKTNHLFTEIDVNEELNRCVNALDLGDQLSVEYPKTSVKLYFDHEKFDILIHQLLQNALSAFDKEQLKIRIDISEHSDHFLFTFTDNGKGINETFLEKVFQPFQKLDLEEEKVGLGLTIVRKIIEIYGGRIWINSELGLGTSVHFTILKNKL